MNILIKAFFLVCLGIIIYYLYEEYGLTIVEEPKNIFKNIGLLSIYIPIGIIIFLFIIALTKKRWIN